MSFLLYMYAEMLCTEEFELGGAGHAQCRAAESFRMPAHLSWPAGPATSRERRTAEQSIAGQWGQLARCTGPGSRTC